MSLRTTFRRWIGLRTMGALALSLGLSVLPSSVQSSLLAHERLRVRNDFKTPEEVVSYYCARDASGFVWSGLLDAERAAFTAWTEAPQQDSFFIATKYEVQPGETVGHDRDQASVRVRYSLSGVGDAHGTRTPPPSPDLSIVYDLKRIGGSWKIVKPDAAEISPIVLEAKFPTQP